MDQNIPILQQPQITPERNRQCNHCHAANNNQDRPLPPAPQPNFMAANEPQAGP
ncbi:uncharacterized protein BJ212DRAFT_1405120, partial [Suillus subaureus]